MIRCLFEEEEEVLTCMLAMRIVATGLKGMLAVAIS